MYQNLWFHLKIWGITYRWDPRKWMFGIWMYCKQRKCHRSRTRHERISIQLLTLLPPSFSFSFDLLRTLIITLTLTLEAGGSVADGRSLQLPSFREAPHCQVEDSRCQVGQRMVLLSLFLSPPFPTIHYLKYLFGFGENWAEYNKRSGSLFIYLFIFYVFLFNFLRVLVYRAQLLFLWVVQGMVFWFLPSYLWHSWYDVDVWCQGKLRRILEKEGKFWLSVVQFLGHNCCFCEMG